MKRLVKFLIGKFLDFIKWVWNECKDWHTFVLLIIVCLVIGLPVWGGYLLFLITGWEWAMIVATALLAFWWLPGAPYFAVCIAITLGIKKIFQRIKKKKQAVLQESHVAKTPTDTVEPTDVGNEVEEAETDKDTKNEV